MKVSVVIPVYNVSAFVERCAESLMRQTFEDVEFLFVDDASTDESNAILRKVLDKYPERNAKIIKHSSNKGLPSARNTGLQAATGEYVFHCDGDDYVEPEMLEAMVNAVAAADADVAWCDFYISFSQNERYIKVKDYSTPKEALDGMLTGAMKYNVWNKLVRRSLYTDNGILFPDGHGMGEDMTMMMVFACAQRSVYIPRAFYHYVKTNTNAFSQTFSRRHLEDIKYNADRMIRFLTDRFGSTVEREIAYFKLSVKFPFLISDKKEMFQLWKDWYPEANCYISDVPGITWRSRWLQTMASKGFFFAVKAYHVLIYRFIYGVIYK